ncbi:MAG: flavodoxin-dependent (E)-4-hydroxy-3-methylbut-2-enyl-diphosphate synthase [Oscillospiraceae bacterium]|nr:flavodoxin-dependent (E)-4-hydroxy-3-methylbut-2-enyl-diphosphate synthase [Oscillospiraceae bacterium]
MDKRLVKVGNIVLGDGNITVQSMLNRSPNDIPANTEQALRLQNMGCDIIRVAVPELSDVRLIYALKENVGTPVVADIHFDYKIAIEAVNAGADKIRINPGNIGDNDKVKAVADACRNAGVPIRIGVNSGSVKGDIVQTALEHVALLERFDFYDIVVSVKSSNVLKTIAAYRELAQACPYPLHLGLTEAGTERMGLIKSSIAIGALLSDGIGDTIRVSLTAEPEEEVRAAHDILRAIGKRKGVEIISCPTCGRCRIDVIALANEVDEIIRGNPPLEKRLASTGTVVAVMGCAVNGPGECKNADYGITGGDGEGLIFKKGEIIRKVPEHDLITELMREIEEWQK